MPRLRWLIAALSVFAAPIARAETAGIDPQGAASPNHLQLALLPPPQETLCPVPAGIPPVRDASDALYFATSPTARHDQEELAAGTLAPLMALRFDDGVLYLLTLGMPTKAKSIGLSDPRGRAFWLEVEGWRPRWPFC